MLSRLATSPSTKVGKFIVLAVWIVAVVALSSSASKFEDAQKNEATSFLPGDAESTKVLDVLKEFGSQDVADAVVVFARPDGLTAADKAAVAAFGESLASDPPVATGAPVPPVFSEDGRAAIVIAPVTVPEGEFDRMDPANISPMVAYLATENCPIAGKTFFVFGGSVHLFQPWTIVDKIETDHTWSVDELAAAADKWGQVNWDYSIPM